MTIFVYMENRYDTKILLICCKMPLQEIKMQGSQSIHVSTSPHVQRVTELAKLDDSFRFYHFRGHFVEKQIIKDDHWRL